MAGQRALDKQRTRERIADAATTLFLERGFDAVTVNQVAAAAGVSKVTVFAHFACKEDLLLDRAPEAAELVVTAIRERPAGVDAVTALRTLALDLVRRRHPLSGLTDEPGRFLQVIAESPALLARARELVAGVESVLARTLADDPQPVPRPYLVAALVMAAYRSVVAETVAKILGGRRAAGLVSDHRARLVTAFDAVQVAVAQL